MKAELVDRECARATLTRQHASRAAEARLHSINKRLGRRCEGLLAGLGKSVVGA